MKSEPEIDKRVIATCGKVKNAQDKNPYQRRG